MEIFTARTCCRDLCAQDSLPYYEIYSDFSTAFDAGVRPLRNLTEASELVSALLSDRRLKVFSVLLLEKEEVIGTVSLIEVGASGFEIGYAIKKEYRRLGLAVEALSAIMKEVRKRHAELKFFQAVIHGENQASIATIERLGFSLFRSYYSARGRLVLLFRRPF